MNSRISKHCHKVTIVMTMVTMLSVWFDTQAGQMGDAEGIITAAYIVGANGLDPDSAAWDHATTSIITLERFIDYVENTGDMGGVNNNMGTMDGQCMKMGIRINLPLVVSVMHNGSSIFFRYEWDDNTADTMVNDTNLFADALAMEIPYHTGANRISDTSLAMGTQTKPVNIIFWRADLAKPQNIVAGGIGTPQPSSDAQNLQRYQNWRNGTWRIIISRPLSGTSDNQITLLSGASYRVAFANWNGSDKNRNGRKAISNWHTLSIE